MFDEPRAFDDVTLETGRSPFSEGDDADDDLAAVTATTRCRSANRPVAAARTTGASVLRTETGSDARG